jgi:hypothetical protein
VNLKIPINSGLRQAGIVCLRKMTFDVMTVFPAHPEDDLPRMAYSRKMILPRKAKSRMMTHRQWTNPCLRQARNWPGPGTSITVI